MRAGCTVPRLHWRCGFSCGRRNIDNAAANVANYADGADWNGLEQTLKSLVRDKVSAHCVPRKFIRADALPMTATGKILRRALR